MNILITSIVDLKKSQHNRPHQFVKHLSEKHDVTVISINDWWKGGQDDLESYSNDFRNLFDKITYSYLTDRKINSIVQEVFSKNKINKIIETRDFDVHLNYNTLVSGYFASKKIKTVYDIADDLSAMIKDSPQVPYLLRNIGGAFGDLMIKKNINNSNMVTLTTDNLRKTYHIPENKYEIISNGVDLNLFKNYKKKELELDGFVVGYVGVLREWIDFDPVFSALAELNSEVKMLIVGKEGRFKENVELAEKYDLKDRIKFTGMIPYSQVPKYISSMDVCVMPFRKGAISENAVPLKLFEYMACEKPVISERLSSVENIANDKILYASNKDEYKNHIMALLEDKKLRDIMGIKGRNFVEKNYDWKHIVERMEKILLDIGG